MESNTRWIVGTIITTGLLLGSLIVSQHSGTNARLDAMNLRLNAMDEEVTAVHGRLSQVAQRVAFIEGSRVAKCVQELVESKAVTEEGSSQ